MIVLKWIIIVASVGYLGGLAVLYVEQRALLFPIPQTVRTSPDSVGFSEAEEHVSISFGERLFALAHEPKQFVRFPEGGHDDLDTFGATETVRQFINRAKD
jgi:hypothetical protein